MNSSLSRIVVKREMYINDVWSQNFPSQNKWQCESTFYQSRLFFKLHSLPKFPFHNFHSNSLVNRISSTMQESPSIQKKKKRAAFKQLMKGKKYQWEIGSNGDQKCQLQGVRCQNSLWLAITVERSRASNAINSPLSSCHSYPFAQQIHNPYFFRKKNIYIFSIKVLLIFYKWSW